MTQYLLLNRLGPILPCPLFLKGSEKKQAFLIYKQLELNPLALRKMSTWQKYREDSECTEERHTCSGSSRNCRDTAAGASISAALPSPPAADRALVTFLVSDVAAKEHERWVLLCRRPSILALWSSSFSSAHTSSLSRRQKQAGGHSGFPGQVTQILNRSSKITLNLIQPLSNMAGDSNKGVKGSKNIMVLRKKIDVLYKFKTNRLLNSRSHCAGASDNVQRYSIIGAFP